MEGARKGKIEFGTRKQALSEREGGNDPSDPAMRHREHRSEVPSLPRPGPAAEGRTLAISKPKKATMAKHVGLNSCMV